MITTVKEDFAKIPLSDAQILELYFVKDLCVRLKDWEERIFTLVFEDVAGMECFGIVGEDLSHGTVDSTDPLIERASLASEERVEGLWCFALWSAWSENRVIRIVARSFKVTDRTEQRSEGSETLI